MRLRIIPVQFVAFPLHPVAICLNHATGEIEILPYTKDDGPIELDLPRDLGNGWTVPDHHQGRTADGGESGRQAVDEALVCLDIGKRLSTTANLSTVRCSEMPR